jgi:hypothetical protein
VRGVGAVVDREHEQAVGEEEFVPRSATGFASARATSLAAAFGPFAAGREFGQELVEGDWGDSGQSAERFRRPLEAVGATHPENVARNPLSRNGSNITPTDATAIQRRKLALLAEQDGTFAKVASDAQVIDGAIANYETAFRMQTEVPELADISREPLSIQKL